MEEAIAVTIDGKRFYVLYKPLVVDGNLVRKHLTNAPAISEKVFHTDYGLVTMSLSEDGTLTIGRGYIWNGPTKVPEWYPGYNKMLRGSCVHDALYDFMHFGYLNKTFKSKVDSLLLEMFKNDGVDPYTVALAGPIVSVWASADSTEWWPNRPLRDFPPGTPTA